MTALAKSRTITEGGSSVTINHEIYDRLEIGSYIYYRPSGEYTWKAKYYASDNSYADKKLATGSRYDTLEEEDLDEDLINMTVSVWRVFSKDDTTGIIDIVPVNLEGSKIPLQGAQEYNNGVKLLNEACRDLYQDASKGITARSINIKDIKDKMTNEALTKAQYYPYESAEDAESRNEENGDLPVFGSTWTTGLDGGRDTSGAFTFNKNYPVIYGQEAGRKINGVYSGVGLGQSEQTNFIEKNEGSSVASSIGLITTSTSIQPKQTYQTLNMGKYYSGYEDYSIWAKIVADTEGIWQGTWIASRYVNLDYDGDRSSFGLYTFCASEDNCVETSLEIGRAHV